MKFSELLGEPEPDKDADASGLDAEPISVFAPVPTGPPPAAAPASELLADLAASSPRRELGEPPMNVLGPPPGIPPLVAPPPSPPTPPAPSSPLNPPASPASRFADNVVTPGSRSGLAELNVRQPGQVPPPLDDEAVAAQLIGLTEIVDDLLPSARRGRK